MSTNNFTVIKQQLHLEQIKQEKYAYNKSVGVSFPGPPFLSLIFIKGNKSKL